MSEQKPETSSLPLVSIITVVFNGADTIEKTIQSVIRQTYPRIEYIIIDGGSKDNTLSIIQKYGSHIAFWLSEPDKGLYDAMNKGIAHAHGRYLWFINSGDLIHDDHTLSDILEHPGPYPDIYYGDTVIIDENGRELGERRLRPPKVLDWKSFRMGMLVCHQSILVSKKIAEKYNLIYKSSADFDWVIRALQKAGSINNTHLPLSRFLQGGMTKTKHSRALKERFLIMKHYYGLVSTLFFHGCILVRALVQVFHRKKSAG